MVYEIPVIWQMRGIIKVKRPNLKKAVQYALGPASQLPRDKEYVEDSLKLDFAMLYPIARTKYPDSDAPYLEEIIREIEAKAQTEQLG